MSVLERLNQESIDEPELTLEQRSFDDAGPMFEVLTSETARSIVVALHEEPATTAEVSDRVGTSVQNASYHLSQLDEAGLVTVAGTRYSEKGHEMDVYAPTLTAIVVGGPSPANGDS